MIADSTVAILGLGLIGGSLARAVSARGARVLGDDRNVAHLDDAMQAGVVHESLGRDLAGIEEADVVVLAMPVDATCLALPVLARRATRARLLMDVASTKRSVVRCAEEAGVGARFVGAHPLAGSHRSGFGAGRACLFTGARVFLCPATSTTPTALRSAERFWGELDACTEALDAGVHDDEMAWRSHLPHFMASALACTLDDAGIPRSTLGPGGRDMSRLAGSSTAMWSAIAADNAEAITTALLAYEEKLREFRDAIAGRNVSAMRSLLDAGREWFEAS
ncbi:MAG TPA: prephenate dehydrogenase [Gemmatimonadaceae bacterium]